jgi:porin-like protein
LIATRPFLNWSRAGFAFAILMFNLVAEAEALEGQLPRLQATFDVYGQLSPAIVAFDDGGVTTSSLADNSHSNSRLGLWVYREFARGELSFNFETAIGFRGTNSVSQNAVLNDWDWTRNNIRKLEAIIKTDRIGTFYLGQGSMASDGVATSDLAGTSIVTYVGIPDTAGSFFLRTVSGPLSLVSVAQAFPNFDGGRRLRVRYDSPTYRNVYVSASLGKQVLSNVSDSKDSDLTIRYELDSRRFHIRGAAGYTWINRQTARNNRTGISSFSVKHKQSGIILSVSSGTRDTQGNYRYFKLSRDVVLPRIGPLSVSVDYYAANHMVTGGSRSESYGIGIIQRFSEQRLETYLGLREYKYSDQTPIAYRKARSLLVGARWKF